MGSLVPDALTTSIDRYYVRQLFDNFFLGTPLWNKLTQKADPVPGGRFIVDQINYTNSPNAGNWGGGGGTLPLNYIGNATEVVQPPTFYFWSIAIPETEEIKNQQPAQILNIVESQFELAQMSLRDTLGTDLYGDGTARGGFATLYGLQAAITYSADGGAGPYGGISRIGMSGSKQNPVGAAAFWNSNPVAINAGGAVTRWKGTQTFGATTTTALPAMQSVFSFCTINSEAPDIIVGSQLTYNGYWNQLTQYMRQATADDLGKQGFTALLFNNTEFVQDDACTNDSQYYLNTRVLKLRPYEDGNFRVSGWRQPVDQFVNVKLGLWMGNVTCVRPNMLGRLSAITA
jgi:hypothetical protein